MSANYSRVSVCNCTAPRFPCQACGAGFGNPDYGPVRQPAIPSGNVTITPVYTLTEYQIEAMIERAVKRAIEATKG